MPLFQLVPMVMLSSNPVVSVGAKNSEALKE
jgi:hypothetical protein